ncbi:MAG: hypothetical protein IT559_00085 [Alphaproteobacteria bacterium]|nr:hypothetical protein [Alphaproteobacteria bacterium]
MVSQNMALPLKENIDFNRHTAHLFCLFHEAAHHAQPTTHIQAGEAFADKTAKDFLEYMKAQGHDEIDLQTIDTLFDLRTIATFQHAQARHFESDYVHGHSTGLLSREEDITDQRGEEHTQNLISLNGLVASLLGGALRPSVHAAIDKEYGQHASLIKNNLDEDTLSEIVKSPELYFLAMPALIELQASKIKYQSDDPEDKFKIFNQENIEIGAAFIKEHPGMHYAFIRGLYDGGFFDENIHTQNPLDKPYIKNYLEAYARIADITPEERAVSKNITQDVKNALPRLREIFSVSLSKEAKTEETNPIKTPVPETLLPKTVLPQP